jgi:hypothetical protein
MTKKKLKKKANRRRDKIKYPGLTKSVNSRTRQDLLDHDYLHKLSPEELQWLSNFNEEYISGNFNHKGEILNKTKEEKRQCYARNNARNRCIFTLAKAQNQLVSRNRPNEAPCFVEDYLIELIDKKSELEEASKIKDKSENSSSNKK